MERFIALFCHLTDSVCYETYNLREFAYVPCGIVLSSIDFYSNDLRKCSATLCKFLKIIVYSSLFFLDHDIYISLCPGLSKNNCLVSCLPRLCCLFRLERKPSINYWQLSTVLPFYRKRNTLSCSLHC